MQSVCTYFNATVITSNTTASAAFPNITASVTYRNGTGVPSIGTMTVMSNATLTLCPSQLSPKPTMTPPSASNAAAATGVGDIVSYIATSVLGLGLGLGMLGL